ncbi:F-box/kelch-repeat protein At3g23880 [Ziziphus jujuba]|uniref:F-box/kelch-repeat protein At3g23880 n=1 Tax=Ziziphus jujuba TaxID=326968 RepID=A0A6P4AQB7_ZIZJJ|nr:F-box/kelch-repeat protein At3g23880 [Ziziphus jujuba]
MLKNKPNGHLPEELVIQILLKQSVRDLLRWKSVCKLWFTIINNPSFIEQHLEVIRNNQNNNKSSNAYFIVNSWSRTSKEQCISIVSYQTLASIPEIHRVGFASPHTICIVGSCNGIVCLIVPNKSNDYETSLLLWNPATKQTKYLNVPYSCSLKDHYKRDCCDNIGFGFDVKYNDYKVIAVAEPLCPFGVKVYSLKNNSWTMCSSCSKDDSWDRNNLTYWGVCSGGMYSWTAKGKRRIGNHKEEVIISFDMTNEVLISTPLPSITEIKPRSDYRTCPTLPINGSLAVVYDMYSNEKDVWLLGEYGVKESWTKLFSFKSIEDEWPFGFLRKSNSEKLLLIIRTTTEELVLFDPITEERNSLPILKNGTIVLQLEVNFTETLVSIT